MSEKQAADPLVEEFFLDWINGNVSPYSFLIEYFYGDCEVDDLELRRNNLYQWLLAAFSEGWQAKERCATIDRSSEEANV
jgi:hypothetical protein